MFKRKTERVRFLKSVAYNDGRVYNCGDVAELEPAMARAVIASSVAEATTDPVGVVATTFDLIPCRYCGGANSEYASACETCGGRF